MIKICGIRDVETAHVAAEAGATAIGLVFSLSPRSVTPTVAAKVIRGLPEDVEVVGVFRERNLPWLEETLRHAPLDTIQVHGCEKPSLELHGLEVIPGIAGDQLVFLPHKRVLVDSPTGEGSGESWEFGDAREYAAGRRVVLAGGLTPENVADAIEAVRPYGVDVSSGVEASRGEKDHGKIRDFVAAAKEAFMSLETRA